MCIQIQTIISNTQSKGNIDSRLLNYQLICIHHQIPNNCPNYLFSKISLQDIKFQHFKNKSIFIFKQIPLFTYKFHNEFIFPKYPCICEFNNSFQFIFKKINSNYSLHIGKHFHTYLFISNSQISFIFNT